MLLLAYLARASDEPSDVERDVVGWFASAVGCFPKRAGEHWHVNGSGVSVVPITSQQHLEQQGALCETGERTLIEAPELAEYPGRVAAPVVLHVDWRGRALDIADSWVPRLLGWSEQQELPELTVRGVCYPDGSHKVHRSVGAEPVGDTAARVLGVLLVAGGGITLGYLARKRRERMQP